HVMDLNWQTVATGIGYTATINPQSTLNTTAFFATTDILIISSGVITLSATAMTNISAYIAQGGRAYIQGEYDCSAYNTNGLFENLVAQFGGGPFNYLGTIAGTLVPMNVLGSLSTTNNVVPSLSYYWYGCRGLPGACSIVEPFLEYNGDYFGFIYCAPNTNGGRAIQTTDQDWVLQNTSTQLMENILNNLSSNTYNCASLTTVGVNLGPNLTICNGQPTALDAGNVGSAFLWSTGATTQTISVNTSGTFWVNVSNGNCQASDTIVISIQNAFAVNLGNDTLICNGQAVTLDAGNPGQTYLWNTGAVSQTLTVNSSGTFWVAVGNGNCTVSDTIAITIASAGSLNLGNDTTICNGQTVTLDAANAGSTYQWSTGAVSQTINVNIAGIYAVTVTNACATQTDDINISIALPPVYALGNDTTYCSNFNLQLNAGNAGANYLWNNATNQQTLNVNLPGTYWVIIAITCGLITDSIVLSQFTLPSVTLGNDTLYCSAFNGLLDATNAGSAYEWSTGNNAASININTRGIYWMNVSNGCGAATDTIIVTQYALPVSQLGADTLYCANFNRILNGGINAASYLWSDASTNQTVTVNQAGTWWVQLNNSCGTVTDTIRIIQAAPPTVNLGNDTSFCGTFLYSYDVSCIACNYLWSNNATTSQVNISTPGLWIVDVGNVCGVATDTVNINVPPLLYLELPADTMVCAPAGYIVNAFTNAQSILWSTGDTTMYIKVPGAGKYWAEVNNLCSAAADSIIISQCHGEYIMPNAFSPNGDNRNDLLFPIRIGDATLMHYEIYNRWGQLVFTYADGDLNWDGKFNDSPCSVGVYIYVLQYEDNITDAFFTIKGNVTLIK
ncbi:MAG: gliding motility-associated C-terminal domain-containing protein, partial [Bacteroidota bacterium]